MELLHVASAGVSAVVRVKKLIDSIQDTASMATAVWGTLGLIGKQLLDAGLVTRKSLYLERQSLETSAKARQSRFEKYALMNEGLRTLFNALDKMSDQAHLEAVAGAVFIKALLTGLPPEHSGQKYFEGNADFWARNSLLVWLAKISGSPDAMDRFIGRDERTKTKYHGVYTPLWRAITKYMHGEDTRQEYIWFRDELRAAETFPGFPVWPRYEGSRPAALPAALISEQQGVFKATSFLRHTRDVKIRGSIPNFPFRGVAAMGLLEGALSRGPHCIDAAVCNQVLKLNQESSRSCYIVYHPFDVAFIKWVQPAVNCTVVEAEDLVWPPTLVSGATKAQMDLLNTWVFFLPKSAAVESAIASARAGPTTPIVPIAPGEPNSPAQFKSQAPSLSSIRSIPDSAPLRMHDGSAPEKQLSQLRLTSKTTQRLADISFLDTTYYFFAVIDSKDLGIDDDPSNLRFSAGQLLEVSHLDFSKLWKPNGSPPSLWFTGMVQGRRVDILGQALVHVWNHSARPRKRFRGRKNQACVKTSPAVVTPANGVHETWDSFPAGTVICPVECRAESLWIEQDVKTGKTTNIPVYDVCVIDFQGAWWEFLSEIFKIHGNEELLPYVQRESEY